MKVTKRDGSLENFSIQTLKNAIRQAFKSANVKYNRDTITAIANTCQPTENIPVEEIQDQIENSLILHGYNVVAKEYMLYRNRKKEIREFTNRKIQFIDKYKKSSNTANSTVDDNSNVSSKNIGVLNAEIHKEDNLLVSRRMVRTKIKELFPDFKVKQYERDIKNHIIYKHDESSFAGAIAPYCVSMTMYPFLNNGIENIGGLSAKPENLDSFCGMYINLIFATSAQFAGAVATSEFLLYFDYFARKEWGDNYYNEYDRIIEPHKEILAFVQSPDYDHNYFSGCAIFGHEWTNRLIQRYSRFKEAYGKNGKFKDGSKTIKYKIHQLFQQVIYSINQPAASRGLQSA